MRTCNGCEQEFTDDSFHKGQAKCKACCSIRRKAYYAKHKARERETINAWIKSNRGKVRNNHLARYGITQEVYDLLRIEQNECCAICGRHESVAPRSNYKGEIKHALHVDHCHTTGQVRGLLCFNCNALLGKARDDVVVLQNAIAYLTQEERSNK